MALILKTISNLLTSILLMVCDYTIRECYRFNHNWILRLRHPEFFHAMRIQIGIMDNHDFKLLTQPWKKTCISLKLMNFNRIVSIRAVMTP